jgi:hypothetical protein
MLHDFAVLHAGPREQLARHGIQAPVHAIASILPVRIPDICSTRDAACSDSELDRSGLPEDLDLSGNMH